MSISIDIAEPTDLVELIAQAVPVDRLQLNRDGYGDFIFFDSGGELIQIEKERARTVINNPAAIEDELRRHFHEEAITVLLLQDRVEYSPDGIIIYKQISPSYYRPDSIIKRPYGAYMAWKWAIQSME